MKILLTADLHLHPHKNSYDRLHDGLKVLEWVNETAIERGCHYVFFCGDLFQDRQRIQVYTYQKVFEVFQKYADKVCWKLLLGNHDLWFAEKWDISSVFPLNAIKNVHVVSKPCSMVFDGVHFDWLPFVKNPVKAINEFFPEQKREGRVLLAHIAVDGAKQGNFCHTSDVSVEFEGDMVKVAPEAFAGWQHVFMGHYHLAQFLDERMQYVGSPYQINFSEANHTPHLVILDTEYMTIEYIENTFSPRHLIVKEEDLEDTDMVNNFVQVVGDLTKFDAFEVQRNLAEEKVRSLEFRAARLKDTVAQADDIREKFNLAEGRTLERYIDAVGTNGLERDLLIQAALEVVDESCQK
jgi:DNA repair exonuclease SbcCD nuclease subunit